MTTSVATGGTVATVHPADVVAARQRGETLDLIDVRTPMEFEQLHAEGARSLPLDQLNPTALAGGRIDDRPIYFICKAGNRSKKAAEQIRAAGFAKVISVEGGTDAWVAAGLPIVRGTSRVISLERQVRIGAGLLVLIGVALGWFVHPAFLLLGAFVGGGLIFAGVTDWCGMGLLLAKMPWNRTNPTTRSGGACAR